MKKVLVLGAGGFIGYHLSNRLVNEGAWVRGVDLKYPEFDETKCQDFVIGDLRDNHFVERMFDQQFDEIYQLAADMGGAGYLFTGENDADIMSNSIKINLNVLHNMVKRNCKNIFYSSSACVYPEYNQLDPQNPICTEDTVYPAEPDSEYGWEKLFSERIYKSYEKNYGLNVKIARFHNIFGPFGTWDGGKEKAPAALCRKVSNVLNKNSDFIELWGDGEQTRSFLYVDDCVDAVLSLMRSDCKEILNIGSDELVSINELLNKIMSLAKVQCEVKHISGPIGVRGRTSDNRLILKELGWAPKYKLDEGLEKASVGSTQKY